MSTIQRSVGVRTRRTSRSLIVTLKRIPIESKLWWTVKRAYWTFSYVSIGGVRVLTVILSSLSSD